MFSFANPEYLYLLLLIPVIAVLFLWSRAKRKKSIAKFGRKAVVETLMPDVSTYKPWIKLTLVVKAMFSKR